LGCARLPSRRSSGTPREAKQEQRKISQNAEAQVLESLKKTMQVNELPESELAKMRQRVESVFEKYTKEVGEPLVKEVNARACEPARAEVEGFNKPRTIPRMYRHHEGSKR
jgi:hypothetical protein